jgi:sugar lactone lactonase YvrE
MMQNGKPRIESIRPPAALPGGEVSIAGSGFSGPAHVSPRVEIGDSEAMLVMAGDSFLIARVGEEAEGSEVRVCAGETQSAPASIALGRKLADNLHPVSNPAVDPEGNIVITFSGQRGQRVPVPLYRVNEERVSPLVTDLVNPTGLAFDRDGILYVSCRNDGTLHRVMPDGTSSQWLEGMGVATGMAFDAAGNLYVGDRSGTIFKISRERQIYVFATLEPSVAAYHLAFNAAGDLFVTGPTQSSFDRVWKITPEGEVQVFYRGLGRPQGLAFDVQGNLYVAASLSGNRGIIRISPAGQAELVLAGGSLVGIALRSRRAFLATSNALYGLDWNIEGLPLFG